MTKTVLGASLRGREEVAWHCIVEMGRGDFGERGAREPAWMAALIVD
ncbi:MAG TPA: hypothetical protein VE913_22360 [Longimicrobium sp.]|nr:hypothetical protein [Longimicrobium sp.]